MKPLSLIFLCALLVSVNKNGISQQLRKADITSSGREGAIAQDDKLTKEEDAKLKLVFKQVRIFRIDLHELYLSSQTLKTNIPVLLNYGSGTWDIVVSQNELRSPDFKHERTTDSGRIEIPRGLCENFAGYERSDPSSYVRLNIHEHRFSGVIHYQNQDYYVETLQRYLPDANEQDIILYTMQDLQPTDAGCGGGTMAEEIEHGRLNLKPQIEKKLLHHNNPNHPGILKPEILYSPTFDANTNQYFLSVPATNCRKLEIATESDYDNYIKPTNLRIFDFEMLDNLNLAEAQFISQFGIKIYWKYNHEWATSNDPYTVTAVCTNSASDRMNELENYWNANFQFVARDLTVLYTGINMNGSTVGCANTVSISGQTTNQANLTQYMMVQTNSYSSSSSGSLWSTANFTQLTTHEIGHILGSSHDSSTANIMSPSINGSSNWVSSSINSINSAIATTNGKNRLSQRFFTVNENLPNGGTFNAGEIYFRCAVVNGGGILSIEGVDLSEAQTGCTLSVTGSGVIILKTAACTNSGY